MSSLEKKFYENTDKIDEDSCEEEPDRNGPPSTGKSYGDPHMITYDGYRYSFQTLGEYVLTKSVGGDFEVQTRQTQVPGRQLSLNTAAAIKVGNNRVAFYVQFFPDGVTDTSLRINGEPTYIDAGDTLELPGGGQVYHLSGNNYQVITANGESVDIHEISMAGLNFMNVSPQVYSEPPGQFIGLLGDLDGDPANDLRTRGGSVIPSRSTYGEVRQVVTSFVPIPGIIPLNRLENAVFDQIYKDFGNSWRVDSAESLFDYAPGEGPATFADPNFPSSYRSLENLTPEQMQEAEAICLEAGVEPELLDGCVFDVAFTEEPGFAQAAANALLDEVGDRVLDEIQRRAPVPIPRLPF
ncbi:MAG: VWD domain-containing protein [Leptolyngbyaceae bacterium]|nr:VWD domain-containing protein [Leptolyngbyaceae bacterium]